MVGNSRSRNCNRELGYQFCLLVIRCAHVTNPSLIQWATAGGNTLGGVCGTLCERCQRGLDTTVNHLRRCMVIESTYSHTRVLERNAYIVRGRASVLSIDDIHPRCLTSVRKSSQNQKSYHCDHLSNGVRPHSVVISVYLEKIRSSKSVDYNLVRPKC